MAAPAPVEARPARLFVPPSLRRRRAEALAEAVAGDSLFALRTALEAAVASEAADAALLAAADARILELEAQGAAEEPAEEEVEDDSPASVSSNLLFPVRPGGRVWIDKRRNEIFEVESLSVEEIVGSRSDPDDVSYTWVAEDRTQRLKGLHGRIKSRLLLKVWLAATKELEKPGHGRYANDAEDDASPARLPPSPTRAAATAVPVAPMEEAPEASLWGELWDSLAGLAAVFGGCASCCVSRQR